MIKPDLSSLCTSVMRDSSALSINHVSWITLSNQAGNWPIRCPLMARLLLNRPETTRRKTERRDLIHSSADAEQKARDKLLARPGEQSHSSVYRIQPLPLSLFVFSPCMKHLTVPDPQNTNRPYVCKSRQGSFATEVKWSAHIGVGPPFVEQTAP